MKVLKLFPVIAAGMLVSSAAYAGPDIKGKVVDASDGEALVGAGIVRIDGRSGIPEGTITDVDGIFVISGDNSSYELSYIGYKTIRLDILNGQVTCAGKTLRSLDGLYIVGLDADDGFLEQAVVSGRKSSESMKALDNERISSAFAIENMGAKEMGLKGISNAMESVTKLTGISVSNAGRITVRGLGDRYSITTLNGMPVGSPNPDNKLAPLEMFPSSTVRNVTVSKVYEASSYADYSGAHVDISTKAGATEPMLSFSLAAGSRTNTVFKPGFRMTRGQFAAERTSWLPDMEGTLSAGNNFRIGAQSMSVNAGVAVKRSYDVIQDAYFNTFEASGTRKSWFEYDSYDSNLDVAALLNIEQTLRRNDRIGLCVFLAGNAMESFQNRTGVDYEERELFGESRLKHVYRLANSQLTGVHELGRWTLDWGISASVNSGREPDRRQMLFQKDDSGRLKFFTNNLETYRYYGFLDETEYSFSSKASRNFDNGGLLRIGLSAKYKDRHFSALRYLYDVSKITDTFDETILMDVNDILEDDSRVKIIRKQNARDRYAAWNAVGAVFAEYETNFTDRLYANLGLRLEVDRCRVDYNDDVEDTFRILDSFDPFVAVNLKYVLRERQWLRLSLSRTITRPSFIEMAPFLYQETYGGAMLRGNAALKNAYNYNIDLRYENFPDNTTDKISATVYVKWLKSPIERIQRYSGGAPEHSFQNADSGFAAGLELEFRKNIAEALDFNANVSVMYTDVTLPEGGVYTNSERQLQGASPYIANADITYSPQFGGGRSLSLALVYNLTGPRIHSVGLSGLGDVIQKPMHDLDFTAGWAFCKGLSLNLSVKNILDIPLRFVQEVPSVGKTVDIEGWRQGRAAMLGLKWTL